MPVVGADEQRPVRPLAHEVPVEPAPLDHHVRQTKSESGIGTRPYAQPTVGLAGLAYPALLQRILTIGLRWEPEQRG